MASLPQHVGLPDRYRVVRHIANGGMASVWAAEDAILERTVAIKVLAPAYAADPAARRRFTREARAAARVSDHPHVVTIFDIGDHDGTAFIVMEHFPGGTVADRLRGGEPIDASTALRWLDEAASALDAAHAAEIVHRDVKPGNLLLDERGRLAVGDFGIASIAGETQVTKVGEVLGTAAYLSPEQARGRPATPASDRFALGVVAYELLCGRRPFGGDSAAAQARARVDGAPEPPTGVCSAAGRALVRALSLDPAQRPPTAAALVDELRAGLGEVATTPRRRTAGPEWHDGGRFDPRPDPGPVAAPRRHRRARRALSIAALVVACLGLGAALALVTDNGTGGTDRPADQRRAAATPQGDRRDAAAADRRSRQTAPPRQTATASATVPQTTPSPATRTSAPATGGDRSPSALNDAGYAMLPADPAGALPLLQQAVERFRATGATGDVNYAYALYNLGWALNLAGRHSEAIPYLEERLRISNYKRGVVKRELKAARGAS